MIIVDKVYQTDKRSDEEIVKIMIPERMMKNKYIMMIMTMYVRQENLRQKYPELLPESIERNSEIELN